MNKNELRLNTLKQSTTRNAKVCKDHAEACAVVGMNVMEGYWLRQAAAWENSGDIIDTVINDIKNGV